MFGLGVALSDRIPPTVASKVLSGAGRLWLGEAKIHSRGRVWEHAGTVAH